jgi:uncharacterized membrane protein YeaQ/YmgE (transglycosylase-associated protein family)
LTPETANGVRVAVHAADAAQAAAVAVAVEIKGLKETQTVEVPLHEGWTTVREGVDWKTIGGLKEAVFVVKPTPGGGSVNGALTLDLEFIQGDFVLKKGPRVGGKIGLVLLTGFLLFLATALVGRWIRGRSPSVPAPDAIPVPGMGRDLLMGSLLTAGLVGTVATFVAGSLPGSEGSFGFLLLGALGALVGEGATRILAQRPGTPGEVFLNFVYTGLVAASSSLQPLWLAPTNGAHNGIFGAGDPVTIAQLAKIAHETIKLDENTVTAFPINPNAQRGWFKNYIASAEEQGWVVFVDGTVDPNRPATRGEVLMTLLQIFDIPMQWTKGTRFTDVPKKTPYASAIETAAAEGIVSGSANADGTPTGLFHPNDPITRAEMAKILIQVHEKYQQESSSSSEN